MPRILRRVWTNLWQRRKPLISLVGNLSYRRNVRLNRKAYADFKSKKWSFDAISEKFPLYTIAGFASMRVIVWVKRNQ